LFLAAIRNSDVVAMNRLLPRLKSHFGGSKCSEAHVAFNRRAFSVSTECRAACLFLLEHDVFCLAVGDDIEVPESAQRRQRVAKQEALVNALVGADLLGDVPLFNALVVTEVGADFAKLDTLMPDEAARLRQLGKQLLDDGYRRSCQGVRQGTKCFPMIVRWLCRLTLIDIDTLNDAQLRVVIDVTPSASLQSIGAMISDQRLLANNAALMRQSVSCAAVAIRRDTIQRELALLSRSDLARHLFATFGMGGGMLQEMNVLLRCAASHVDTEFVVDWLNMSGWSRTLCSSLSLFSLLFLSLFFSLRYFDKPPKKNNYVRTVQTTIPLNGMLSYLLCDMQMRSAIIKRCLPNGARDVMTLSSVKAAESRGNSWTQFLAQRERDETTLQWLGTAINISPKNVLPVLCLLLVSVDDCDDENGAHLHEEAVDRVLAQVTNESLAGKGIHVVFQDALILLGDSDGCARAFDVLLRRYVEHIRRIVPELLICYFLRRLQLWRCTDHVAHIAKIRSLIRICMPLRLEVIFSEENMFATLVECAARGADAVALRELRAAFMAASSSAVAVAVESNVTSSSTSSTTVVTPDVVARQVWGFWHARLLEPSRLTVSRRLTRCLNFAVACCR
jgi:hypothetical protein